MGGSTHKGHILTESRGALSPSPACPIFLSLYIHILSPPWFYVLNMYWFRNFTYSPPRFFAPSFAHRTYQPCNPLRSLLQRVFLRSPSPIPPTHWPLRKAHKPLRTSWICPPCLIIIQSFYCDCRINKPFACSRCFICVSCSVHVISCAKDHGFFILIPTTTKSENRITWYVSRLSYDIFY